MKDIEDDFNFKRKFNYTTKKTAMEAFKPEPPLEELEKLPVEHRAVYRLIWRNAQWDENYKANVEAREKTRDAHNKKYKTENNFLLS